MLVLREEIILLMETKKLQTKNSQNGYFKQRITIITHFENDFMIIWNVSFNLYLQQRFDIA